VAGRKRKENGNLPLANCLSQLQSNWLFFFLQPQGVLSFHKRKKGLGGKEKEWQFASGRLPKPIA